MVAASKSAMALPSRSRRASTWSDVPRASSCTSSSSSWPPCPARMSTNPSKARTSRSRTFSRNSPVAIRVKVMTRRRSIGRMPSATYLVVSAAMVNVLPVPALACRRVMPVGSVAADVEGPAASGATTVIGRPPARAPAGHPRCGARAARRNASIPSDPTRPRRPGARRQACSTSPNESAPPSTSRCSGSLSSLE